jgi:hypothetical protein
MKVQHSSVPIRQSSKDFGGPDDLFQLHEISTLLIQEDNLDSLYSRILGAAISLMSSDMGRGRHGSNKVGPCPAMITQPHYSETLLTQQCAVR